MCSFGSDLFYDYVSDTSYLLSDRGPGGGVIGYNTRYHEAKLKIDSNTGKLT